MAAGDHRPIKNAIYRHTWVFRDNNGNVKTSVTSITAQVQKDTGGLTTATNSVGNDGSDTIYHLDLTSSEMAADLIDLYVTGSAARGVHERIVPEPALDSGLAAAGGSSSITLASTATATADLYNGATIEIVRGTGAGQIRTITDYSAGRVATVDRSWVTQPDTTSVYLIHPRTGIAQTSAGYVSADIQSIHGDTTAAENMEALYEGAFLTSSVDDASPTTTSFAGASGLSSTDDFYNKQFLVFTSGTLKGIAREITDYTGGTLTFTVSAFPTAPSNGDTFIIIARNE